LKDIKLQTYQLHIYLEHEVDLTIGRLGTFTFPAGRYVYTGSAKRNLDSRVRRHLSDIKKKKWHIDYLLASPLANITRIEQFPDEECIVNRQTEGAVLIKRFGATDCKKHCGSHLKYLG
jgi:Uri superfamily endonuclease